MADSQKDLNGSIATADPDEFHAVTVDLQGFGSRVFLDGRPVEGLRDVKVHQPLEGPPIVTIELLAASVKGFA